MDGMPTLPPGKSNFARLIEALRRKNPRLNEFAAETLCHVGKPAVPLLAWEAAARGKQPDHRVRILDAIQRIGEPLDEAFFDLTILLGHPVERVRQA